MQQKAHSIAITTGAGTTPAPGRCVPRAVPWWQRPLPEPALVGLPGGQDVMALLAAAERAIVPSDLDGPLLGAQPDCRGLPSTLRRLPFTVARRHSAAAGDRAQPVARTNCRNDLQNPN